jgi:hypothetical protein
MRRRLLAAPVLVLSGAALTGGVPDFTPSIDFEATGGRVAVVAWALSTSDAEITGTLTVRREGAAGTVSTRQSSTVRLVPGEGQPLATVVVSFESGDRLEAFLTLSRGDDTVAITSASFGAVDD